MSHGMTEVVSRVSLRVYVDLVRLVLDLLAAARQTGHQFR